MKLRAPAALILSALLATGLIACGGDDDGSDSDGADSSADASQVLEQAFSSEESVESGVLDLSFQLTSEGEDAGNVDASLSGPFQGGDEGSLPQTDLTADATVNASGVDIGFDGGLTLTSDGAFVSYDGTAYEVDDATFQMLEQAYAQSLQLQEEQGGDGGSFSQFGVDPASWLPDASNDGTEDLDGEEVVHVSGEVDIPTMLADLQSIAEQSGGAAELDPADLKEAEDAVDSASIDVYASSEDSSLRKLDLNVSLTDPSSSATADIVFSIGISEPNEPQEISAPEDPQPIAGLLEQIPGGAGALDGLGGLGATGSSSSGGGSSDASGASTPDPVDPATEKYLDCIAEAPAEDVPKCADLLPG